MKSNVIQIACLHAHHGNIGYLDDLMSPYRTEMAHFVDPALVRRIGVDPAFSAERATDRVREQLKWIAESGVDGIVVTCTAYVASMPSPESLGIDIPIVTIDEPFFAAVCASGGSSRIFFTNPGTVDGTMGRLKYYAKRNGFSISPMASVIPGAFDLFMAGRQAEHDALLTDQLLQLAREADGATIFAGQLSMSAAARRASVDGSGRLISPLDTLEAAVVTTLSLSLLSQEATG